MLYGGSTVINTLLIILLIINLIIFKTSSSSRRFGFMFGGGRSGMYGLQALQQVEDPMHLHTR